MRQKLEKLLFYVISVTSQVQISMISIIGTGRVGSAIGFLVAAISP
jgi:hypothetical protein